MTQVVRPCILSARTDRYRSRAEGVQRPRRSWVTSKSTQQTVSLSGQLIGDNVLPIIPNKSNWVDPWPLVPEIYRERSGVERLVNKLKQFRGIATNSPPRITG